MAQALYLSDGSTEVLCHVYTGDPEKDREADATALERILFERLGSDVSRFFREIFNEAAHPEQTGDDYEAIADGYRSDLCNVMEELEAIEKRFSAPRLDREGLHKAIVKLIRQIQNDL